ncbi:hypothetical protein ATANTOWER_016318 [Ataeniobius toweri]|uniref:Uncharacterized protein n=1 Tax=Ataeniobius toweri TaxID=208326 RepID=A0ABU7A729_9TELE|nr:hypothetical protein [Ataeniobius toweri]
MRPPHHVLHSGPASKPWTQTVGTSQSKDQAVGEKKITLWEYLWRAEERSARQAREEEEQRLPFWGSRLAIPLVPARDATLHLRPPSMKHQPGIEEIDSGNGLLSVP